MKPLSHSIDSIFWFRRDFRVEDNHGLFQALINSQQVLSIFIFDTDILSKLQDKDDARVTFIHEQVSRLKTFLQKRGSDLFVFYGNPGQVFQKLISTYKIKKIYCNEDYEPLAIARDQKIAKLARSHNIQFLSFKDHVIFAKDEILTDSEKPYTVFTPYKKKWLKSLKKENLAHYSSEKYLSKLVLITKPKPMIKLSQLGFHQSKITVPKPNLTSSLLKNYAKLRDTPSADATSHIGPHLRFGTISIRSAMKLALKHSPTWTSELIWREFFIQVLWHHPHVVKNSFRAKFDSLNWSVSKKDFQKWCEGKTGIPIVDAGMRELNTTGYMHNRVRMITANFLTKHLFIHWSWGEKYFAQKLLDYELASNNGNWQWSAGTGCDAAPYFRIFNPETQQQKFDPDFEYIQKWVPEYGTEKYPEPMVDLNFARRRALIEFGKLKKA